jgi:hypothetical protein
MTREIKLEKDLLTVLKKTYGTIQVLVNNPLFGAAPAGINSEFIFEIKCPSKESTKIFSPLQMKIDTLTN